MAPRTTTHPTTPAALVADAISSLQKAVGNALASAEDQGKVELARAREEAEHARRERDDALKQVYNAKVTCKEWERQGEVWKGSSEKSEMTIKHQAETISQLREEAQQWKSQLLRYEETSRREIQDWKEQYLRAEQERSRLSARLDQLIAEQLELSSHASGSVLAYPPRTSDIAGPSRTYRTSPLKAATNQTRPVASTTAKPRKSRKEKAAADSATDRERTYVDSASRPPSPAPKTSTTRTPKQKTSDAPTAATRKSPTSARASTLHPELSPPHIPQSQLIRRVKAVIEVPVKEEEYSDVEGLESSDVSEDEYVPARRKPSTSGTSSRRSSIKGKQRARYVETDDEEDDAEASADEDLLLLASEDDAGAHRDAKRAFGASHTSTKHARLSMGESRQSGSAKKRKLDMDAVTAQKTQSKVPRKR